VGRKWDLLSRISMRKKMHNLLTNRYIKIIVLINSKETLNLKVAQRNQRKKTVVPRK
jgi:hypothetical protein